jgi:flagellar hook-associated protein 1 FlgK
MSNLFVTGLSGLQAFRQALDVTGQNIANANTDGYVRQRADFSTRESTQVGACRVGNGVQVSSLTRIVNDFLADQSRDALSAASRLEIYAGQAGRVAAVLGDPSGGVSIALQRLQNAIEGVATEPSSMAARQSLLGELEGTVSRLRGIDSRLREFESETNGRIATEIDAIDGLAGAIAGINREIRLAQTASGSAPNDLLDQRDRLVDQLATKVSVRVVAADDGAVNITIGRGQSLVMGERATKISMERDPADASRQRIVMESDGVSTDITAVMTGGAIGGLVDFRGQVLDPARNELGRIATTLAASLNEQHAKGIDLLGASGGQLLAIGAPQTQASGDNAAVLTATASVADATALAGVDYRLEWTGSAWDVRRSDTGAVVTTTGTGSAGSPLAFDGLSVVIGGSPATGDSVLLRPTRGAVEQMSVRITAPGRIAAALPVRPTAATGNTGSATVAGMEVLDPSHPALRTAVSLTFPTPTTVSVDGNPPQAWSDGQEIDFNGWRLRITGVPAAGDSFSVVDNGTGRGDNRNAIQLADRLRVPLLDTGTASLADAATRLMSGVGTTTQLAQRNLEVQRLSHEESVRQRQGVSGVNLDEEAANLLRFQQAYQASAQVIRAANEVFRMLIDIGG